MTKTDWRRLDAMTDEDIEKAATGDPDARIRTLRELRDASQVPETVDVKAIRTWQRLSQGAFARMFGLDIDAVQDWEQGRRQPNRAARVLLTVINREPEAVRRALRPETKTKEHR